MRRLFCTALLFLVVVVAPSANVKVRTLTILTDATTTVAGAKTQPGSGPWSLQAFGTTGSGAGAALIVIEVSNIESPGADTDWITAGTITLTLGTTRTTNGFASAASWRNVRARVTSISGTGAKVSVVMGIEA